MGDLCFICRGQIYDNKGTTGEEFELQTICSVHKLYYTYSQNMRYELNLKHSPAY